MEHEIRNLLNFHFAHAIFKFNMHTLTIKEAYETDNKMVIRPGIYIFWVGNKVWKVGRHLVNVRKRSLEHIRDNTKSGLYEMNMLLQNPEARITYVTVLSDEDLFWVPSLEMLCEIKLTPLIRSKIL